MITRKMADEGLISLFVEDVSKLETGESHYINITWARNLSEMRAVASGVAIFLPVSDGKEYLHSINESNFRYEVYRLK